MERISRLIHDPDYIRYCRNTARFEQNRIYCRHDMAHFLDVARIAYILNLEEGLGLPKERIYAAALVHDIGRWKQYQDGTPHEEAGVPLARPLLLSAGFPPEETEDILCVVAKHRKGGGTGLADILFRADKRSRACHACAAEDTCDWAAEKKNMEILY
ncbi:MAG: HD domain-containing protein [Oscillospiraceae bacterium]|nr:HD domain-containing protein [Oscillospiraceae bacterium]